MREASLVEKARHARSFTFAFVASCSLLFIYFFPRLPPSLASSTVSSNLPFPTLLVQRAPGVLGVEVRLSDQISRFVLLVSLAVSQKVANGNRS